jgi:hypothetical protein
VYAFINGLTAGEKATLLAGLLLVLLSLIAGLFFVGLVIVSGLTKRISHYWNPCFVLCSIALGGWMIFYAAQLRFGGGVMILLNNVLLFWFLVCTVVVSATLRFASPQRYVAIAVLTLSLLLFEIAVPGFLYAPIRLIHDRLK